jgi:hypothetical protein
MHSRGSAAAHFGLAARKHVRIQRQLPGEISAGAALATLEEGAAMTDQHANLSLSKSVDWRCAYRAGAWQTQVLLTLVCATFIACGDDDTAVGDAGHGAAGHDAVDASESDQDSGAVAGAKFSFFVTSDKSTTGSLGGLVGADARCAKLAKAVGAGDKTWHAYLSVEKNAAGAAVDARDRIGKGPWYNVKGALLAEDLDALHARTGDAEVFLDEHGDKINGQWVGSPAPVEHDVLTGSNGDGTLLVGKTCADWTSDDAGIMAQVGHTDGLGPSQNANPPYSSWNSAHANGGCNNTGPLGGAGRLYCFAL